MKTLAFALTLVLSAVTYSEVVAQDFWYIPPGYENGYYYGLNLGNGVGYGYGFGLGLPVTADALGSTSVADGQIGREFPVTTPPTLSGDSNSPPKVLLDKKPIPAKKIAVGKPLAASVQKVLKAK